MYDSLNPHVISAAIRMSVCFTDEKIKAHMLCHSPKITESGDTEYG